MIRVIEKDANMRRVFEKTLPQFIGEDADLLFVNISALDEKKKRADICTCVEEGSFIMFYGDSHASALRRRVHPVVRLLYRPNTAYFQIPPSFFVIGWTYQQIKRGRMLRNPAMQMLVEGMAERKKIGDFLRDIASGTRDPHDLRCLKMLRIVKKELGIEGPFEKVRKQLQDLQRQGVNPHIRKKKKQEVVPGIFCDLAVAGSSDGIVDPDIKIWLTEQSEKYPIVLVTNDDVEKAEELFSQEAISCFPFASFRDFRGCTVQAVVSRCEQEAFEKVYEIKAQMYIEMKDI